MMPEDRSACAHEKPRTAATVGTAVAAAFIAGALAGCSPYVFSGNVQNFSGNMGAIDAAYASHAQSIVAEQHLARRIEWIRDRKPLEAGPGCDSLRTYAATCEIVLRNPAAPPAPVARRARPAASASGAAPRDVCEPASDTAPAGRFVTPATVQGLTPLQRAGLLKALDHYSAALAAVTKAQDRTEFDNASALVSTALGGLAQSAAAATGSPVPVGPVVKASSNLALWLVGQGLDHQRLAELRLATREACEPIHSLAKALEFVLEEQRVNRLLGLQYLLVLKIQAVNIARTRPQVSDQAYGAAIDDAQAAAAAFQTVRATDPQATAQALSDAHDALVLAVRNNDGEFTALVASLQAFAGQASQLAGAAGAVQKKS